MNITILLATLLINVLETKETSLSEFMEIARHVVMFFKKFTKSAPIFIATFIGFLPGIARASSVDISSGGSRVIIDRQGQVYVRDGGQERNIYSDSEFNDDFDRVIPPLNPSLKGSYRSRSPRNRFYRTRCKTYSHRYNRYGSSSYSSTTVCN